MARRYTARITQQVNMEGKDANDLMLNQKIDLAVLHSQRMQRNVRQGKVFHIHKVKANLMPETGGDLDVGLAFSGTARWCPATRNSVKAWQMAFNTWRKQKSLRLGAVGHGVRYDDFEMGYNSAYTDGRTSSLFSTGMGDTTSEKVVIYGSSTDNDDITLEDLYESTNPQVLPSRFPLDNSVVKEPKYTEMFPPEKVVNFGCNYSAVSHSDALQGDSGAAYNSTPAYVQDGACLGGVMVLKGSCLAEDVALNTGDLMLLTVEITYSVGRPLVAGGGKPFHGKKRRKMKSGRQSNFRTYRRKWKKKR